VSNYRVSPVPHWLCWHVGCKEPGTHHVISNGDGCLYGPYCEPHAHEKVKALDDYDELLVRQMTELIERRR